MTNSSTSSARFPRISTHGVPTRCWCGEGITTFGLSTTENRYRRFYRCEIARDRKTENHLFKWIEEALIDEIRMVDAKHERVSQGITKFEEKGYGKGDETEAKDSDGGYGSCRSNRRNMDFSYCLSKF
ncbi:hypothetical protein F2Q70_00004293 [Brassica cretica]|nr:hypothetical protein F2Q70_00004293 [Brassica cretica]